jgi:hypothetical protein
MYDDGPQAEVLNGKVGAGDYVAYSTRSGSNQDMHVGEVLEVIKTTTLGWYGSGERIVTKLRVRVTDSSSCTWGRLPRAVMIGCLERVVKVDEHAR